MNGLGGNESNALFFLFLLGNVIVTGAGGGGGGLGLGEELLGVVGGAHDERVSVHVDLDAGVERGDLRLPRARFVWVGNDFLQRGGLVSTHSPIIFLPASTFYGSKIALYPRMMVSTTNAGNL